MGLKTWRTTTELEGRIGASAWHWLQTVGPFQLGPLHHEAPGIGIGLARALFSRLLLPKVLFTCTRDHTYWASLGRGKWAALAWPMIRDARDGTIDFKFDCSPGAGAQWHHVVDVDAYQVIGCVETFRDNCIMLRMSGDVESLPKSALRKSGCLSLDDLDRLARHYALIDTAAATPGRPRLLSLLVHFIGAGDIAFIEEALRDDKPDDGISLLAQDPLFEYAFDELELENRLELGDLKRALDKQKTRNHVAGKALKRRQVAMAKAGAKAKAAPAHAEPPPPKAATI